MTEDEVDQIYLAMKGCRERLARAQKIVPAHWRSDIDTIVHIIDQIGSSCCPQQWSVDNQPEYPEPKR